MEADPRQFRRAEELYFQSIPQKLPRKLLCERAACVDNENQYKQIKMEQLLSEMSDS